MQKSIWQDEHLKSYNNSYCDLDKSLLFEFFDLDDAIEMVNNNDYSFISENDCKELYEYVVLKNLHNDVKELTIKAKFPLQAFEVLKKHGLFGNILCDARVLLNDFFKKTCFLKSLQEKIKEQDKIFLAILCDDILSFSEAELSLISELAGKQKLPLYINFLRTLDEAGNLDKLYNKSPARVLEDFGFPDRKAYLVGCNFLDKDDANLLASYEASLIITPLSDMMLGRGAVNLQMPLNEGIEIKIGSDCYPFVDMLEEGKIATGNTANIMFDPFAITRQELEKMIVSDKDVDEFLTEVRLKKQKEKVKEIFRRKK